MEEGPFIEAIAPLGSWLLVIVGWIVVHRLAHKRVIRSEIREQVMNAAEQTKKIAADAVEYWTSSDADQLRALGIQRELKELAGLIGLLRKCKGWKEADLNDDLRSFRQACTDGEFGVKDRQPASVEGQKVRLIQLASSNLIRALRERFAEIHGV